MPAHFALIASAASLKPRTRSAYTTAEMMRTSKRPQAFLPTDLNAPAKKSNAPIAIKASGISLVIANTFARIFYRNSINIGLAIVECPEAVAGINDGDKVEADLDNGIIYNRTTGKSFKTQPFPEFIQKIIQNGGLIESIRKGDIK
jgi:3-isopropylmalate/(R)-2-methylmalate dehydratase small subunit